LVSIKFNDKSESSSTKWSDEFLSKLSENLLNQLEELNKNMKEIKIDEVKNGVLDARNILLKENKLFNDIMNLSYLFQ
jgi:hypothetical protein